MFGAKYEHGVGFSFDNDSDKKYGEVGYTQCAHCGCHFILPKWDKGPQGKGKYRGFHMLCNGWICGPDCPGVCGGQMRLLDILEGRINPTAVSIAVPRSAPVGQASGQASGQAGRKLILPSGFVR